MDKKLIKLAVLFSCCFLTAEAKAPKGADLIEVQRGENPRPMTIEPPAKVDRPMNVVPGQPQPGGPQAAPSSTPSADEEMEESINADLQSDEMKDIDRKMQEDEVSSSDVETDDSEESEGSEGSEGLEEIGGRDTEYGSPSQETDDS